MKVDVTETGLWYDNSKQNQKEKKSLGDFLEGAR